MTTKMMMASKMDGSMCRCGGGEGGMILHFLTRWRWRWRQRQRQWFLSGLIEQQPGLDSQGRLANECPVNPDASSRFLSGLIMWVSFSIYLSSKYVCNESKTAIISILTIKIPKLSHLIRNK